MSERDDIRIKVGTLVHIKVGGKTWYKYLPMEQFPDEEACEAEVRRQLTEAGWKEMTAVVRT